MSPNQFRRNHQSGQPDQEFKQGVQSKGRKVDAVSVAAHQRAREPGTSPKSRHKHGKNDRGQRRGHAKLRHRQPQPYEFAQNATESRDKEEPEKPYHSLLPFPVGLRAERRNRKQLLGRRKVHSTIHATRLTILTRGKVCLIWVQSFLWKYGGCLQVSSGTPLPPVSWNHRVGGNFRTRSLKHKDLISKYCGIRS